MKIQRIWAVAAASVVTLSTAATAQQAPANPPVERITFQQAIEIALRQNLAVRNAENNLDNANMAVSQAGMQRKPNLALSVGGSNQIGRAFDPQTGNITTKNTQGATGSLSTGMTLWDFGRIGNSVRSARYDADASEASLFRTRQTAVYNVAVGFVTYVSAQSQLDVQKENLTSLQLQESQIQRFADAGARPISDLYQIKSQVANAQLAVVRAEAAIENAKFGLMRELQLDAAKDYDFVPPPIPDTVAVENFKLDSLVTLAYARRRDVVASQNRLLAAQADYKSARVGHYPSLSASANYGSNGRFNATQGQTGDPAPSFISQFNDNRGGGVSVNMSVPIFDRGATNLNKRRVQIEEETALLNLGAAKQTVALDVRTAWFNVRSAQQQLLAARAGLVAATQALEATTQRYNVGAATLLDVTQARASRVQAQSALNDARYQLVLNQAAMAYFTGELDPAGGNLIGR